MIALIGQIKTELHYLHIIGEWGLVGVYKKQEYNRMPKERYSAPDAAVEGLRRQPKYLV